MTTRFIGGPLHGQSTADYFKPELDTFSATHDADARYRRVIFETREAGASAPDLHTFYVHQGMDAVDAQRLMAAMVDEESAVTTK
ncbi:hypothetical protein [Pigmentiphaga litoralis]|uniref:hypothetical protein n=1 Tax=Pigmentiphaga litoralis TaxID=516702 RepID=UPI003B439297